VYISFVIRIFNKNKIINEQKHEDRNYKLVKLIDNDSFLYLVKLYNERIIFMRVIEIVVDKNKFYYMLDTIMIVT
jgi:hypothetical protein